MAEKGGGSNTLLGPIRRILFFAFLLGVALWIFQIVWATPDRRAVVACYPPYKLQRFFTVTIPSAFNPRDLDTPMENQLRAIRWNDACIEKAGKIPGIDRVEVEPLLEGDR